MSIVFPQVDIISIPMSYVSALIGKHPYKDMWDETINVFRRYNSGHEEKKPPTIQEQAESPLYKDIQTNHKEFFDHFIKAVKIKKLKASADNLIRQLCVKHKVNYRSHRMLLTKKRGHVLEKAALDLYASTKNVEVYPVEKKLVFLSREGHSFQRSNEEAYIRLVGKADGKDSRGRILEVKCRRAGFRDLYFERLQLATYILAYDMPGTLIEFYENELRTKEISKQQAKEMWSGVYEKLSKWSDLVSHFMEWEVHVRLALLVSVN